jgi:tetratricopeptide (TPR) repeat protein
MNRLAPRVGLAAALLVAGGCAAFKPPALAPGPAARVLDGVPVRKFGVERCGAGSLSAVLNYYGDPVELAELHAGLPKGRHGGVITLDLLLAARQRGFEARLVQGSPELVTGELAAGRPVILMLQVLDSLGEKRDLFHYVVLDGVDPTRGLVRLQWGDERPVWTTLERIDRPWRLTDRTTLLVAPGEPGEAASHTVRYAVALEEAGRGEEAVALYRRLVDEEPTSALVWTNLANAEAQRGRHAEAELAYRRALELAPESGDTLNNLAWLLYEEGERLAEAEELARRAVAAGGSDAYLALDTLGRIQRAAGRCPDAAESLAEAERTAPRDAPGREELALELALAERDCAAGDWRGRLRALAATAGDAAIATRAGEALAAEDGRPEGGNRRR